MKKEKKMGLKKEISKNKLKEKVAKGKCFHYG